MKKVPLPEENSHSSALAKCKSACFFDKNCRVWQYSTLKGCWSATSHYSSIRCFEDFSLRGTITGGEKYSGACESQIGKETNYVFVFVMIAIAAVVLVMLSVLALALDCCRGPSKSREKESSPRRRSKGRQISNEDGGEEEFPQLTPSGLARHEFDQLSRPYQGVYQAVSQNGSSYSPASGSFDRTPASVGSFQWNPQSLQQMGRPPDPPKPNDASFGQVSSQASSFSGAPLLMQKSYPGTNGM
jgi:hypothetical protein